MRHEALHRSFAFRCTLSRAAGTPGFARGCPEPRFDWPNPSLTSPEPRTYDGTRILNGCSLPVSSMIGQTISHYRVVDKLGGGGMGVTYEAEDTQLRRHVVLKFIPEGLRSDPKSTERFLREARSASQLNHPNICTIYDVEEINGEFFMVMEKLEGISLKDRMRDGPIPVEEILDIAIQVLDGLAASHAKGIIHRDIKPANIFLTQNGR